MLDYSTMFLIGSYNCCGFSAERCGYIRSLLSNLSVLFVQEHWLSDSQLALLGTLNSDFLFTGVSGFGNRYFDRQALWWLRNPVAL